MAHATKALRRLPFYSAWIFGAATLAACGASQQPEASAFQADEARAAAAAAPSSAATVVVDSEEAVAVAEVVEVVVEEEPEPVSDDPERDLLDAALSAAADGDTDRALRGFQALEGHAEYGPYAQYNLGVLAFARGEREQARRYFHAALDARPGFGPAMVALVRESIYADRNDEAQRFIDTQRTASNNAPGVRAAALFLKLDAGDYRGVITDTRSVLIDEPANLDAHYALAMANLHLGRVELADYVLQAALRRDANRADIHYGLGRVAMERGRDEEARAHFEKAVELNELYPEANVDLASLQLKKLEYADVVVALEPVTQAVPEFVHAWINLGSGLKGIGKVDEAKLAFQRALELDPTNASAAFNMGILYLDVTHFEELEQLARMEEALRWFSTYRDLAERVTVDDPVHGYEQFVRDEIQMQEDLARQAAEDEERARLRAEREAAAQQAAEEGASDDASDGDADSGGDDDWDDWDDW